mgnify:CR=1 FL=1
MCIRDRVNTARPTQIRETSCARSPAFSKGINEHLLNASITFDRFPIAKIIGDAVDSVRRSEWRKDKIVKGAPLISD